jgi:hypothetical protein
MAGGAAIAAFFGAVAKIGASNFAVECEVSATTTPPINIAPLSIAAAVQIRSLLGEFINAFLLVIDDPAGLTEIQRNGFRRRAAPDFQVCAYGQG